MKKFFAQLFNDNNSINEKSVVGFLAFVMMTGFAIISDKDINDSSVKSSDLKNPTDANTPDNGVG